MGIEYFIFSMEDSATKEDILDIFSPYWTEIDDNYYFLDYGVEVYEGRMAGVHCHFSITFGKDNSSVEGLTIFKPCGSEKMERAVFKLISDFPMFVTYPSDPLVVVTANPKCVELLREKYPDFLAEDVTVVSSYEEYIKT
ncbi:hypothetical protein AWW73_08530 [Acinetobacter lactucae]|uniref:hypothetical protein n=1 Tax=Acinetobacter calcoaceticus/baumannii complex TaxID=909768 RepID=UPI0007A00CC4|nr:MULTISPECIES: hypothetical protein [Acinetobacter calcoaceticus/baumannii complex]KYQ78620.1 hypothetical protein AWW73_08530 [Acinetobacter lactucae]MCR6568248.1 hypothetical protein [Acinetobacter baumannii]MDV4322140.1 hypothetical protein [Acinetobacter baumannii]MDV4336854.1 hypothetical protein [Acinetobacter baumannii]RSP95176.1 hypothetical protein EA716_07715 [Acinetobacter baumannii]